ncbi:carcinoembryonic antigen-related cell adhesion molecule 1-like [Astyanax mexicanus]|uniref:carcinoembryonic antigen-related cell adhesion molecule 1-like n=1 Tax=Astyanax mexicanus TaxID=7994 RepID=UPI0020CB4C7A|nr:carcinoembryonic antigen-related cell adhesion molecule 1-like [Astyanax mexicanus]
MPGGHIITLMLLIWSFVGGGICERNVEGVLHGRVELHACHRPQQTVKRVEWIKYKSSTQTRLLYTFEQSSDTSCFFNSSQNIQFIKENRSLIFVNLTKEDEGVYQNKLLFNNGSTEPCNITLSVLSPATALRISVSSSNCTLTLRCEVRGQFLNLRWFWNGLLLPDDQRISISERNLTVHVSNLNHSDSGTYTCRVSNKAGTSEAHVNITENTTICQDNVKKEEKEEVNEEKQQRQEFLIFAGLGVAVISTLLVCIILICICRKCFCRRDSPNRRKGHRKTNDIAMEEPVYDEPNCPQEQVQETSFDEEPDAPIVNTLPYVYTDFIKPKAKLTEKQQDEEAGYSTIAEMQANKKPLQNHTGVNKAAALTECMLTVVSD